MVCKQLGFNGEFCAALYIYAFMHTCPQVLQLLSVVHTLVEVQELSCLVMYFAKEQSSHYLSVPDIPALGQHTALTTIMMWESDCSIG